MSRARTHLWYDVVWPAATGLVTGLGLVAAYRWTGPVMFLVALAVLELTVAPVAWSLFSEVGLGAQRIAFHIAPATAVALLSLIGLADVIGGWTFLLITVVVLTSPLVQGWTGAGVRGVVVERVSRRSETRRRFDDIVAHGFGPPDEDLPPR